MLLKFIKILSTLLCIILILSGCSEKNYNTESDSRVRNESGDQLMNEKEWAHIYELEVDKIVISVADYSKDKANNELLTIVEITEKNEVENIINSIKIDEWKRVDPENELKGIPYFYILIGSNTVISMYSDTAYGTISHYSFAESEYEYFDMSEDYYISKDFFIKIWEILEPYYDTLDVEIYK